MQEVVHLTHGGDARELEVRGCLETARRNEGRRPGEVGSRGLQRRFAARCPSSRRRRRSAARPGAPERVLVPGGEGHERHEEEQEQRQQLQQLQLVHAGAALLLGCVRAAGLAARLLAPEVLVPSMQAGACPAPQEDDGEGT